MGKFFKLMFWITIGIVVLANLDAKNDDKPTSPVKQEMTQEQKDAAQKRKAELLAQQAEAARKRLAWDTSVSVDEMTGEKSKYANSIIISPTKTLKFPYHDLQSWLGIGSDDKSSWAYIGFSDDPNLTGGETESGYNKYKLLVKVDDKPATSFYVTKEWGSNFIHIREDSKFIALLKAGNNIKIEFPIYGNGDVIYNYPLVESAKAITSIM